MRVLILWADDRSANLGVRVLAEGTAALVRRVWPEAECVFQNYGRRIPELPIGSKRSLIKERVLGRRGMMPWLAGFDLVVDTRAGDSFADIYGLPRLEIMSLISEFAAQAGVPVVLGPQTIGPFDTRLGRLIGRRTMQRATAVMARDSASVECAAGMGIEADILTTDVVFALPAPVTEKFRDVVLNVSGLLWNENPHVDHSAYRRVLTTLASELGAEGRTISLLAHVLDSPDKDNDVPAVREFAAMLDQEVELIIPEDLQQAREAAASAEIVIGSRMHACLNALSVGTPAIPLAYSRKFAPLLSALGWDATVDLRSDPDPAISVLKYLRDDHLLSATAQLRERADTLLVGAERSLREAL